MPKLPRDLGYRDVERALSRLGFQLRHARGHNVWASADRTVTVPRHETIKVGTLREIIRQAGVTPEEFINAL